MQVFSIICNFPIANRLLLFAFQISFLYIVLRLFFFIILGWHNKSKPLCLLLISHPWGKMQEPLLTEHWIIDTSPPLGTPACVCKCAQVACMDQRGAWPCGFHFIDNQLQGSSCSKIIIWKEQLTSDTAFFPKSPSLRQWGYFLQLGGWQGLSQEGGTCFNSKATFPHG